MDLMLRLKERIAFSNSIARPTRCKHFCRVMIQGKILLKMNSIQSLEMDNLLKYNNP